MLFAEGPLRNRANGAYHWVLEDGAPTDSKIYTYALAQTLLAYAKAVGVGVEAARPYLEETWGYDHALVNVASDTHLVCDWSRVDQGVATMPACEKGTCSGHRADDLLPWGDFLDEGETYTNYGFYEFMSPENDDFPYVYDSLTEWPGCEAQGIYFGQSGSDDGSSVVTSNSATDDMSGDTSSAP